MKLSLGIRALSLSLNKERVARRIATATMRDASIDISFARSSAPSSKQPLRGLALSGTLGDLEIIDGSARRREWVRFVLLVLNRLGLPRVVQLLILGQHRRHELGPPVLMEAHPDDGDDY